MSDIFSLWALKETVKNLPLIYQDPTNFSAKRQMLCVLHSMSWNMR